MPQTGLDDWEQSGDSAICSQMGYGRKEERKGTGFRGSEEQPRGSAWSRRAPREPDSRKPQCGSSDHETNHSEPLGMFACVCMHECVCGYGCVYISVYLYLLSPRVQASKCACVYVCVWSGCVCSSFWGQVHTLLSDELEPLLLAPLRTPGNRTTHHSQEAPYPLGLLY